LRVVDEAKKGHFRRRTGDGTNLGSSLYSYPTGTNPNTLAQYKVVFFCRCPIVHDLFLSHKSLKNQPATGRRVQEDTGRLLFDASQMPDVGKNFKWDFKSVRRLSGVFPTFSRWRKI